VKDRDLARRAFALIQAASACAPLGPSDFGALAASVDALAEQASDPDLFAEMVAEQLAWLEPGGQFESPDLAEQ
jgi:predicted RNA polymerase sigma factor